MFNIDDKGVNLPVVAAASVPTPAAGTVNLFVDSLSGNYSQKDANSIVSDLVTSIGSSPPQVDLSSYSGADVALALGQNAIYTFPASITSLPLKIATGDNQSYKIEGFFTLDPAANDAPLTLSANNTTLGTSIKTMVLYGVGTVSTGAAGQALTQSVFNLSISTGRVYYFSAVVSTKTNGKSVTSFARQANTTAEVEGKVSSISSDVATVWSSLGTITFPTGYAGRVVVTKLSDATAGGGVPGIITGGPSDAVQVNSSSVLAGYAGLTYNDAKGLALSKALVLSGDITPAALAADTNDYNPAGLSSAYNVRVSSTNNWDMTGLVAGVNGEIKQLLNVGTNHIHLVAESSASAAANRFNSDTVLVANGGSCRLRYDGTLARWMLIGNANNEEAIYSQALQLSIGNMPLF